ncbi:PA0069 family radical SAM protein [Albibacterium profundi]|uniref:PA0069 family radical SAM protein n=1 Tax=Albibacterium profundi TaxID=3134906 RepID=A0ABV5CDA9_9SPHI
MSIHTEFIKGRGSQINPNNKFLEKKYVQEFVEGLDEEFIKNNPTKFFKETPKKIISINNSPDLSFSQSINPYQGCEHGCIYCYARNSHEYWGFSAGLDFERKIIVKHNAAQLLEDALNKKGYIAKTIVLSGNTDCYQPIERKLKITRSLLEIFNDYQHPVSIITKNNLILRDSDLLKELAAKNLISVAITINSLNESLRQKMEPRTVTAKGRLNVIEKLSKEGIPVMLMCAPIIPGLNSDEMPKLIKAAADAGACSASFTMVRLNGAIADIFTDWVNKTFPDRAEKILHGIQSSHGGHLNDSDWSRRMRGDGHLAESIHSLFKIAKDRYMKGRTPGPLRTDLFIPKKGKQLNLFGD